MLRGGGTSPMLTSFGLGSSQITPPQPDQISHKDDSKDTKERKRHARSAIHDDERHRHRERYEPEQELTRSVAHRHRRWFTRRTPVVVAADVCDGS